MVPAQHEKMVEVSIAPQRRCLRGMPEGVAEQKQILEKVAQRSRRRVAANQVFVPVFHTEAATQHD